MLRVSTMFIVCALVESCAPNQVWNSCGTACPLNCQNFRTPPDVCILSCNRGCFCKEPYIFQNGTSGPCVLPSQCPPSQVESCAPNQVWNSCGTACPLNCQNFRNPPDVCILSCQRGCFCKEPYIFQNGTSGPCVLPSQCPPSQVESCAPNQVWNSCGTACPLNCQNFRNPPAACILSCQRGCFCKQPYIFQNGTSGPCVLPSQCPPSQEQNCLPNQFWESCGSYCSLHGQNFKNPLKICPTVCKTGCSCKGPHIFLRGKSGPVFCPGNAFLLKIKKNSRSAYVGLYL
ncbi:riddle 4 L homeolog isoform X3 [Xenopus laevis]|uniref:Riddle 4 L homeolog isoform X3 n=1 Tax=Xenopus laevis TaxID=8355 RepID=A0A8J1L5Y2_XENLA|nr:riddle 4 L homeolog isoform X3 [Xenopus laevis]XP_041424354.1 riddle 4 L homeolog isoform X3 [Xenopus laevis]